METSKLIEMRSVTKEYRGVAAVRNVDFTLMPGEVHALLGENGAGKSTLTKMMAGVTQLTEGMMLLDGRPRLREFVAAFETVGAACRIERLRPTAELARRLRRAHDGWAAGGQVADVEIHRGMGDHLVAGVLMLWAGAMLLGVALFCRGRIPGCRQVKRRVQVRKSGILQGQVSTHPVQ